MVYKTSYKRDKEALEKTTISLNTGDSNLFELLCSSFPVADVLELLWYGFSVKELQPYRDKTVTELMTFCKNHGLNVTLTEGVKVTKSMTAEDKALATSAKEAGIKSVEELKAMIAELNALKASKKK